MANTLRESTARLRSENAIHTAGSVPIPALGFGPHLSTAVHAIRQECDRSALPIPDPTISLIVRAVDTAFALHNKANGSTVSLTHGDMARRKFFAVSPYPARTIELWERPTWQDIFDFALANRELLVKPHHALGTWFNDKELVHVLDIAVCCADRAAAIALAKRYRQSCIYDLATCQEIHLRRLAIPSQQSSLGGHDA